MRATHRVKTLLCRLPTYRRPAVSCQKGYCKGLLQKNGDAAQSVKLTDLLAQQELQTEASLADMTDAQHLLSALTPSLKANALTTLGKVAQQDEKTLR